MPGFLDTDDREMLDRLEAGDDVVGAARAWVAELPRTEATGKERALIEAVLDFERVLAEQAARRPH